MTEIDPPPDRATGPETAYLDTSSARFYARCLFRPLLLVRPNASGTKLQPGSNFAGPEHVSLPLLHHGWCLVGAAANRPAVQALRCEAVPRGAGRHDPSLLWQALRRRRSGGWASLQTRRAPSASSACPPQHTSPDSCLPWTAARWRKASVARALRRTPHPHSEPYTGARGRAF